MAVQDALANFVMRGGRCEGGQALSPKHPQNCLLDFRWGYTLSTVKGLRKDRQDLSTPPLTECYHIRVWRQSPNLPANPSQGEQLVRKLTVCQFMSQKLAIPNRSQKYDR